MSKMFSEDSDKVNNSYYVLRNTDRGRGFPDPNKSLYELDKEETKKFRDLMVEDDYPNNSKFETSNVCLKKNTPNNMTKTYRQDGKLDFEKNADVESRIRQGGLFNVRYDKFSDIPNLGEVGDCVKLTSDITKKEYEQFVNTDNNDINTEMSTLDYQFTPYFPVNYQDALQYNLTKNVNEASLNYDRYGEPTRIVCKKYITAKQSRQAKLDEFNQNRDTMFSEFDAMYNSALKKPSQKTFELSGGTEFQYNKPDYAIGASAKKDILATDFFNNSFSR